MSIYLSNRDGSGKTNEEGHYRLQTKIFTGFNLGANDLKVVETGPLAMTVWVSPGDYRLETSAGYSYTGWIDTNTVVTITTADPANPRITCVVIYVDKTAATSASPPNNPGITKVMAVNGTPAGSPTAPSGAAIQTAVGAGNPYYILANVAVGAAVTQITNANITDLRTQMTLSTSVLSGSAIQAAIGAAMHPIGSIYMNAAVATNPATLLGFGTWVAYGAGRVPVGFDNSQTEFDTLGETGGTKTETLTAAQIPAHSHQIRVKNDDFNFTSASSGVGPTFADARDGVATFNNFSGIVLDNTGGGGSHNNLQPYITVYMWRRTA